MALRNAETDLQLTYKGSLSTNTIRISINTQQSLNIYTDFGGRSGFRQPAADVLRTDRKWHTSHTQLLVLMWETKIILNKWTVNSWMWDHNTVPKRRAQITQRRGVTSHTDEDANCTAIKTWSFASNITIGKANRFNNISRILRNPRQFICTIRN
jgi:hypothetical protein